MSTLTFLSLETIVKPRTDIPAQMLDGDLVMANLDAGKYYGMGATSKRIWELIQQPQRVSEICARLLDEYEIDRATCEDQVLSFLNTLHHEGLIERVEPTS